MNFSLINKLKDNIYNNETFKKSIDILNENGIDRVDELLNNPLIRDENEIKESLQIIKDIIKKLESFDENKIKYYNNKTFDLSYKEFLEGFNVVSSVGLKNDILNKKKEELDRINNNKIKKFYDQLIEINKEDSLSQIEENIKKNNETRAKIALCRDSFLLSNQVVKTKNFDEIKISLPKEKVSIIKEKHILLKKRALEKVNSIIDKMPDPKDVLINGEKAIIDKIDEKKENLSLKMSSDEEINEKIENLSSGDFDENNDLAVEILSDIDLNKKINKKIKLLDNVQKICTAPHNLYKKTKEKYKNVKEKSYDALNKVRDKYNEVGENLENLRKDYASSIKNEEEIKNEVNQSNSYASIKTEASKKDIADAIEDLLNSRNDTFNSMVKENNRNKRRVKFIGSMQKLHTLPKTLVKKIKDASINQQMDNVNLQPKTI